MLLGRGCRVSAHPMPCAVPAAHPGACRGSGTFCSLMRPPSHARVLSPALRAAQTKRQIDVLLSGCISGILRSIPAMLLLSRSSLALCFPSFFLPKERGLGLQDPANPPDMLVQRGVPCPALCRDCVYPFPPGFWSTSAPVSWLEAVGRALCRALPLSSSHSVTLICV